MGNERESGFQARIFVLTSSSFFHSRGLTKRNQQEGRGRKKSRSDTDLFFFLFYAKTMEEGSIFPRIK